MNCPYCSREMESGVIQSPNEIAWKKRKALIFGAAMLQEDSVVLSERSFFKGSAVTAFLCRHCKKVIINYELSSESLQRLMEAVLRVPNCLYVRYKGVNEKLQFAYNKLGLTAFEEEIALKGDSYTVFVREDYDTVIADVFMPQVDE